MSGSNPSYNKDYLTSPVKCEWLGKVDVNHVMGRVKVPGGWLIIIKLSYAAFVLTVTFYPDPDHAWDGTSLP